MSVIELQSCGISNESRLSPLLPLHLDSSTEKPKCKLREPRDLYSTASLLHPPKWPIECQVIPEKIKHIDCMPKKPEPFYMSNNIEPQPKPVGEEMGTIVYHYEPKLSVDYFCRSCVGGAEELQTYDIDLNTLKFESRFESGNLRKALKITNVYYELYLKPDMYTDRNSQWFYFRIQNMKENIIYRFSIVNLNKPDSLYRFGLKPLMYSEKDSQISNSGWTRCGYNIAYYKNDITSEDSSYTLTFNMKFRHSNDTVYIAQCYPYTYSKLQSYLNHIETDRIKSKVCQQRLLCRSLAGNNVYVLTISSPANNLDESPKKPVVVISARVHPGETQSSYMMKGIIDFLISENPHAQELRERFIFKLIPMLNPDGVIVGNSRCCLLGQDLNRQYRTVLREAFPQIYHTKVMLRRLVEENGVFLYIDLHGHSRRHNVFIYGCENKRVPEKRLIEQVFPLMMHKNASDKFSFQSCKFKIQRSKEGTGRVFAWTLGVANSFTLEVSLGGSTLSSRQQTHFNTSDYEAIGRHFCETLMDYSDPSPEKEKIREKILMKLYEGGSTAEEPINVAISDYSSLSHSETDSEDEKRSATQRKPIKRQFSLRLNKKKKQTTNLKERTIFKSKTLPVNTKISTRSCSQLPDQLEDLSQKEVIDKMEEGEQLSPENKFRRKYKKFDNISDKEPRKPVQTKCTNILFDDPFSLPAVGKGGKKVNMKEEPPLSHSEDECDDDDSVIKNRKFYRHLSPASQILHELSLLHLAPSSKKMDIKKDGPEKKKLSKIKIVARSTDELRQMRSERRQQGGTLKYLQERRRSLGTTPSTSSTSHHNNLTIDNLKLTKGRKKEIDESLAVPRTNSHRRISWTEHSLSNENGDETGTLPTSQAKTNTIGAKTVNADNPFTRVNHLKFEKSQKTLTKSKSLNDKSETNLFQTNLKVCFTKEKSLEGETAFNSIKKSDSAAFKAKKSKLKKTHHKKQQS